MDIFYGSGNPSKVRNMKALINGLSINLITPLELPVNLPDIEENGETPWENAKIKALAYYEATKMPSMGLDSGLYIEGLPAHLQPGTHVRRVNGKTLSDDEFIQYYCEIAKGFGGRVKARFVNGLCAIVDEAHIKCAGGAHISTDWFWIVAQPHATRIEGFPMDSIAIDPITERYWVEADLENEQYSKGISLEKGIREFFIELMDENYQSKVMESNAFA